MNRTFSTFRWRTEETIDTRPFSHHPYQYAYNNPINYLDPTGKCVPESDGPYACDPSLLSTLKQYLRDSHPFDSRARSDQGYQGINVVFDNHPEAAYAYSVRRDSELRAFVTGQLPWLDAEATIGQLDFNLQQWKLNYAQQHNLPADLTEATAGILGLGAVYGVECFFSPDTGITGGSGGRILYPRGPGASEGPVPSGYTKVWRWTSKLPHRKRWGFLKDYSAGQSDVSNPSSSASCSWM